MKKKNMNKKEYDRQRYLKNKEAAKERAALWAKNNPEKRKDIKNKWLQNNKDKYKEICRNSRNKKIDKYKQKAIEWNKRNSELKNSYTAKRRALKIKATLPGFDAEIKEIYLNCPKNMQVDHIVPLRGKTVSGLHVPWNLQYLSPEENRKKSNKW